MFLFFISFDCQHLLGVCNIYLKNIAQQNCLFHYYINYYIQQNSNSLGLHLVTVGISIQCKSKSDSIRYTEEMLTMLLMS